MAGLFQNGHELEYCEGPADLQVLRSAIQQAQDREVVPTDVEDSVALQVEVAVEGLGEHLMRGYQGAKGPGAEGDEREEIEVHIIGVSLAVPWMTVLEAKAPGWR